MDTNNNATTNPPNSANPALLTSTPTPTAKKTELDQSSSTAAFDAAMRSEASFGLSQFMTESPPFTCSLKARYSDFVVQEISKVDGSVASPLSSDHDNIKKVNEDREMRKEEKNDVWKLSEEERLAKFEEELKGVVTFEDVEGLKSFLEEKREVRNCGERTTTARSEATS